ncbi:hypothetical protein [Microbacterium sp. NPDC058389]|uniref:hypothetical protein n=1 Tax=Microbacterium sp. NPDC058389 TaxID=3346475 RepID=UPI003657E003
MITALSAILALSLAGCAETAPDPAPQELDLEAVLAATSDYQKPLIADGVVTSAEYEKALLARRDCVEAAGAVPGEIYEIGNNELTFDYEYSYSSDEDKQNTQVLADACIGEYFREVGAVWAYQQLLTPAERDKEQPTVLACMDGAGHADLSEDATAADMVEAIIGDDTVSDAEQQCLDEHPGFFATWTNDRFTQDHVE